MYFEKKNKSNWKRAALFEYFIQDLRCVMSLTVKVDVTDFVCALKDKNIHFYPAMIWVVSAAVNQREELRMGYNEKNEVGVWGSVSPSYVHFYPEDQSFLKLVTEFDPDFSVFYHRFLADKERFKHRRGFVKNDSLNTFDVSCLPWIHYQSFDMHIFDSGTYLAPVVTWGQYAQNEQGRLTMPLTLNLHHAVADGYHLCRFFEDVQAWMKKMESQK